MSDFTIEKLDGKEIKVYEVIQAKGSIIGDLAKVIKYENSSIKISLEYKIDITSEYIVVYNYVYIDIEGDQDIGKLWDFYAAIEDHFYTKIGIRDFDFICGRQLYLFKIFQADKLGKLGFKKDTSDKMLKTYDELTELSGFEPIEIVLIALKKASFINKLFLRGILTIFRVSSRIFSFPRKILLGLIDPKELSLFAGDIDRMFEKKFGYAFSQKARIL